eukprot:TRINITY_DN302_c6_g1_i1.p1 TRINITY_DN302_c6_g1~~TRINITY_DN302_c6_g1_i1.p1  ORF type:complete len:1935 (+),score=435.09 TRINITY_DN302_c6_g1_i1:68-5806(+)
MKTAAALLLLVGSAVAQWNGVTLPRVPTGCPTLLPLTTTPVSVASSSFVSISAEAWCNGQPIGGLAQSQCGSKEFWHLADDRDEVSTIEAELSVQVAPGSVQTIVLIDLSNSVQQSTPLTRVREGAKNFVNHALDNVHLTGPHMIAIYTFDGRREAQLTHTWSADRTSLLSSIDGIVCGQPSRTPNAAYCVDSSTNLYGTLIFSAQEVERRFNIAANNLRLTSRGHDSAILVFTDGNDLANYNTYTAARNEITRVNALVFAVGVRASAGAQFGPAEQQTALQRITLDTNAAFLGDNFDQVPSRYLDAAKQIVNYFSRNYRLSYCSPRRARTHTLDLKARYQGVLGERMEYIRGLNVRYVQNGGGLARTDGIITNVLPIDAQFQTLRYLINFPNSGIADRIAFPNELDIMYSTAIFGPTYNCLSNTARTATCAATTAGSLMPYTCTGGATFQCSNKKCDCAVGGSCVDGNSACFNRDQSMTPPLYVDRQCANGLPAAPLPPVTFTRATDSTLSLVFSATCADGSPIGGLTFSPCNDLSSISILESDGAGVFQNISLYESRPRITCIPKPAHVTSLLLLDMSSSILRGYGGLARLKQYAVAYVEGITTDLTSHVVAVYTFDGQNGIRLLSNFGTANSAVAAINALDCGSSRCIDPSTNLNGALVAGNQILRTYHAANPLANDGTGRQPFIVLLSDGADQAQYNTDAEGVTAATNGTGIFAIGLQGEPRSDVIQRGVDISRLTMYARNSIYIVATAAELKLAFSKVGAAISSAAASSYRLDYCSPKRSGPHTVRVQLSHHGSSTYWEQQFDANFDCSNQACKRCLANIAQDFSCSSQPGPSNQNFVCANNAAPLSRDGYCRCPCTDANQYPPATQVGPGPITCEPQGTCSRGDRVTCTTHGGLNQTVQQFSRFGISSNSRVSMEFTPTCADNWPMPKLRMSVCDSLSDFRVFETDANGNSVPVSKFESEPRITCFPDVVTLILLDTSGSIQSVGTEAALKTAVVTYLQTLQNKLSVTHNVAIYAFDGRAGIQRIQGFTSNTQTSIARMNAWSCMEAGGSFCQDDSTNLYGAVINAEQVMRAEVGAFVWRQKPYMVLFTDGTDQASRNTEAEALAALAQAKTDYTLDVYGVGIQGERRDGVMGLDSASLARLAPAGASLAQNTDGIVAEFDKVANQIIALTQGTDTAAYRLDYCSPKRSGVTTVTIELTYEGQVARFSRQFNASSFSCNGDACSACLSKNVYTCVNQPPPEQQFFQCDSGQNNDPLVHNGVCKCPCTGTYPPDFTVPPTPTPTTILQLLTPAFAPLGGSYNNAITVTITSTTNAIIYYTTDGTNPTTSSLRYMGSFNFATQGTTTIRAIATMTGFTNSNIGSAVYTINNGGVVPTPTPTTTPTACTRYSLSGFSITGALSTTYTRDSLNVVNGMSTYWSNDAQWFVYRCSSDNFWYIASRNDRNSITTTNCPGLARTSALVSGVWNQRVSSTSTFSSVNIIFTCLTGTQSTPVPTTLPGAPTAVVISPAVVNVDASRIGNAFTAANILTSVTPGADAFCTARDSTLFIGTVVLPIVTGNIGNLVFTPAKAGSTFLDCSVHRSGITTALSPIQVIIGNAGTGILYRNMRIALKQTVNGFNVAQFTAAIRSILGANVNVVVNWVCPEATCWNKAICSATSACRISPTGRVADVLQSNDVVYVDFDIAGYNDQQLVDATSRINTDVQRCWDGLSCSLSGQNPDRKSVLVNSDGTSTFGPTQNGDDDDSLETWEWILIIAGCLLFLCLVIIIIACLMKGKKNKSQKGTEENRRSENYDSPQGPTKELQPYNSHTQSPPHSRGATGDMDKGETSYYEDSYSSPSGSQSQSYYSTSYAPEKYEIDEKVKVLYLDGQWYDATIWSQAADGSYEVKWHDGQHSDGIPLDQIQKA